MKKDLRTLLSLLFVLIFAFQCAGAAAWADDAKVDITGEEHLVYELYVPAPSPSPAPDGSEAKAPAPIKVTADKEAELLGSKSYKIELGHDVPDSKPEIKAVPLTREAGKVVLNDLLKEDLTVTPPEGFYVKELYLRGDALETDPAKPLPVIADKESGTLTLKAGALATQDEETKKDIFNKETLSSYSTVDPQIYALVVVLAPIDKDAEIKVTESQYKDELENEVKVKRGDAYKAPDAPADTEEEHFTGWLVRYDCGATLALKPGDSFKPFADCRVEAQWQPILTITANTPVRNGDSVEANGYQVSGKLAEGDTVSDVTLTVSHEGDQSISTPSAAIVKHDDEDVTGRYAFRYVPSDPLQDEAPAVEPTEEPAPEKVAIAITAKPPVTKDGGKTYEQDGVETTTGLREGDALVQIAIGVEKTEDGKYVAVPSAAVIKHGDEDVTASYEISYVKSAPVTPEEPAPEKVAITITAKPPVTKDGGKTYENDGVETTTGLREGDALTQISIGVEKTEDGKYVAVPSAAVIKHGDEDVTASYEISYVKSAPVAPEDTEKTAITIRSKDRSAEYTGSPILSEDYEITSGALKAGDTIEVSYEGGSTNVTSSPVPCTISKVVIKDSSGKDVTESYTVTIDNENAGKITVTKHTVTLTAITGTVTTDGNKTIVAKECKTADGSFVNGFKAEGLLSGHAVRGDIVLGSGKETFTTTIDKSAVRIVDTKNGDADVTANYEIKTVDGKLTIKVSAKSNVPVAVTTKDQSWTYDGTAHKLDQSAYNISGLLDGDVAVVTLKLKQGDQQLDEVTNAGSYTIVPVISFRDKDGNAIASDKYTVTATNATLTVKKYDLTLEAVSATKAYDGKALRNDVVKATPLLAGHSFRDKDGVKFTISDSKGNIVTNGAVNVGTYVKKVAEVHIIDSKGNEVTANYNITKKDGTLTITPGASDKNNSNGVRTGDSSNSTLYIILIVASVLLLVSIVAFILLQRKKRTPPAAPVEPSPDGWFEKDETKQDWQQDS